ncbi:MAG: hypothetical protein ABIN48_05920 [Ginsengibacter sp.]
MAVGDWRLAVGGWRLAVGDWRLAVALGDEGRHTLPFNHSTIQQFNNSTIQPFNNSTIQPFNNSTIQQFTNYPPHPTFFKSNTHYSLPLNLNNFYNKQ